MYSFYQKTLSIWIYVLKLLIFYVFLNSNFRFGAIAQDINDNLVVPTEPTSASGKNNTTPAAELVCPGGAEGASAPLLSVPCDSHNQCLAFGGTQMRCCPTTGISIAGKNRCIKGVVKPTPEPVHTPLFGLVKRRCPSRSGGETYGAFVANGGDASACETDEQCGPLRICCQDPGTLETSTGTPRNYCYNPILTSQSPILPASIRSPLETFASYLQCTPPPPPILDLFPKPCKNGFDCFPNLCCQEAGGKHHCRPPRRSVLAFLATMTQRIGSTVRQRLIANQKPSEGLD